MKHSYLTSFWKTWYSTHSELNYCISLFRYAIIPNAQDLNMVLKLEGLPYYVLEMGNVPVVLVFVFLLGQGMPVIAKKIQVRIMCFLFSLNSLRFSIIRENLNYSAKLQFLNDIIDQNTKFAKWLPLYVKVGWFQKQIVKPWILPKNNGMNSFLLLCDVFSFVFRKKLKTPKKPFKITWPL